MLTQGFARRFPKIGSLPRPVGNPTNAVGGSFILRLHTRCPEPGCKSHQRSWWIVHTLPTYALSGTRLQIPPTQLVDRSYSAYIRAVRNPVANPTNAVGGSFILCLHTRCPEPGCKSHQRSWWIVHTLPT